MNAEYAPCPSCTKEMPIYENEKRWCPHCEWNLILVDENKKDDRLTQIYKSLGKQLSLYLFKRFSEQKVSRPKMTKLKFLALLFATLVHLVTLSILVGIYFVYTTHPNIGGIIISLFLAALFWIIVPKPRKYPKDTVPRDKTPTLYKLLDEIADKMGTKRVAHIVIDEEDNAFYNEFRFKPWNKKVIGIGVPLVLRLNDEELIAILAHETSHGANDDLARGAFIGFAKNSLAHWYYLFTPRHYEEGAYFQEQVIWARIGNLIGVLVGTIPLAAYQILARLLLHTSQEAEYIADRLATEVCGTDAMLSMLQKLPHGGPFVMAVSKAALSHGEIDLYTEMKSRYEKPRSSHDIERVLRTEIFHGLSFDATHPPTAYRIKFIKASEHYAPKVKLNIADSAALRSEIEAFKKQTATKLIDNYLNSIYS